MVFQCLSYFTQTSSPCKGNKSSFQIYNIESVENKHHFSLKIHFVDFNLAPNRMLGKQSTDQLRAYREADLRCKKQIFS